MALPADLAFSIKFDLTNSPANFELADDTDYSALGLALEDIRGNFTSVTDPLANTIHNNTNWASVDILPVNSLLYTGIDCPTDTNGNILQGQYSFTYNIKVDNPITAVGANQFTIAGDYAALINAAGSITIVRSTGNNGTYTVIAANYIGVETFIDVVEVVPSGVADGSMRYSTQTIYSLTQTATYSNVIPAIDIDVTVDCFCGSLISVDSTNYGTATIQSRTHTVMYPNSLQIADIVSSGATVTVSPIYTKTWTTKIVSTISIPVTGGTIVATITGSEETDVECDLSFCDIACCVIALNNRYLDARTTNTVLAEKYFKDLTRVVMLMELFSMAYKCDRHDLANTYLAEIKQVGNCSDGCSCSGDEPNLVVPLCGTGAGTTINVTAGSGITVTATYANGIYTYQVGLSASALAILNSVAPQNIIAGTGISVAYALVAGVDTWTITNTATYTAQNRMEMLTRIQYTAPTAVTITKSAYLTSGSNMNATATVASQNIATAGANNHFRFSGFQVAANNTYKVTAELVIVTRHGGAYSLNSSKPFDIEIFNKASGQFDFRFIGVDGLPMTNTAMSVTSDLYVNFKISQ